jgi:hypothetical protein
MVVGDDGDIIRGLGFVTLYSAYLEEEIDRCVEVLKGVKGTPPSQEPGPKWSASRKLEYCLERSRNVGIDYLEIVTQAFEGGKGLFNRRHDVVHGRIYAQDDGDIRRSGRRGVPDRPIASAELYALVDEFHQATIMFSEIADFYIPDAVSGISSGGPA